MGPCMAQVTWVESPWGSSVNSTMLWVSNGFTKSSLIATLDGATDSAISMRPWPTSRLPSHAYTATLPLVTALKVRFMAGAFSFPRSQDFPGQEMLCDGHTTSGYRT